MKNTDLRMAERTKYGQAAKAQDHLLAQPVTLITAVKMIRKDSIARVVFFQCRI